MPFLDNLRDKNKKERKQEVFSSQNIIYLPIGRSSIHATVPWRVAIQTLSFLLIMYICSAAFFFLSFSCIYVQ